MTYLRHTIKQTKRAQKEPLSPAQLLSLMSEKCRHGIEIAHF